MKESQSSCSFSITRSIDNSVDDGPVPNLFDFGCNEIYNTEDNVSISFKKKLVDIGVVMKIVR